RERAHQVLRDPDPASSGQRGRRRHLRQDHRIVSRYFAPHAADLPGASAHPEANPGSRSRRLLRRSFHGRPGPLGFLDFLHLMSCAKVVLTDSGGIQEETTILGVPCITLRENTERPVTLTHGTNVLVGADSGKIVDEFARIMRGARAPVTPPQFWDGHAATRIIQLLVEDHAPMERAELSSWQDGESAASVRPA